MKKTLLLFPVIILLLITYFSCTRKDTQLNLEPFKDPFVNEAISFVQENISTSEFEWLDLKGYSIMRKNDIETIGVRFNIKGTNGKRFVVVGKTDKGLIGNWVDVSKLEFEKSTSGVLTTSSFSGQKKIDLSFAEGRLTKESTTIDGKSKIKIFRYNTTGDRMSTVMTENISSPDSEEEIYLPEVTVVGYYRHSYINFHSLFYYFNNNPAYYNTYQTTNPYIYGYGGGSGSSTSSTVVTLQPLEILSGPAVDLVKRINCFNNVPTDANTTYAITLYADIPNNSNPDIVAVNTTPGHAFITLTKTNGATSVSQTFGFYPENGAKSISFAGVDSKIVNDAGHEYNAKITIPNISQIDFNAAKNLALSTTSLKYDLNDYNCTNYAVGIFNQVMPLGNLLNVQDHITPAGVNYKKTPNGLYKLLNQMKQSGGQFANNIEIGTGNGAESGGECN